MNARSWKSLMILAYVMVSVVLVPSAGHGQGPAHDTRPSRPPGLDGPVADIPPGPAEQDIAAMVFSRFAGVKPDEVMAFIKSELPHEFREFRMLAMRNGARAVELLTELVREAVQFMEASERNPPLFEMLMRRKRLERLSHEQAEAVRSLKGESRARSIAELRKTLEEAFKVRQELMKLDVEQMTQELNKLRSLLERREGNSVAIINRRVSELTGDHDALEW